MVICHHHLNGHEHEQTPGDSEEQRRLACSKSVGSQRAGQKILSVGSDAKMQTVKGHVKSTKLHTEAKGTNQENSIRLRFHRNTQFLPLTLQS